MLKKHLLTAILVSTLSTTVWAQDVYDYTLKNGLKLFVKPDHRSPTVVSQIWYKVGSSYENNGLTGLSHALEHMMFRGTAKLGPGKFFEKVHEHGGSENAFTTSDFTAYHITLPSDQLELTFELEADRMQNLLIDEKLFEKEMKAILEERRLRIDDSPQGLLSERFQAAAYTSSPYRHPILGWRSDLDNMTVHNLRKWYQDWYGPNNAMLVVVGDVNPEETYQLAQKHFGDIQPRAIPKLKPRKEVKALGAQSIAVNAPAKLPIIVMGYPTPSLLTSLLKSEKDAKTAYALEMISNLLSLGEGARLKKDLVRKQEIATFATSQYDLYQKGNGLFIVYAVPAKGKSVESLKKALLKQIENLRSKPIDKKELERVKSLAIAHETYKKDSLMGQAEEIGSLEAVGLSHKEADDYLKQIERITTKDIQKAAQTFLAPEKITVGVLKPQPIKSG